MSLDLHHLSAWDIAEQVRQGTLKAEKVVLHFLERIERLNPEIGAFILVLKERALEQAKRIDARQAAGETLGKLAGVPVGIKDNIHVEGELSTCASKFLTNYRAPFAATAVRLIEEADGIPIGKCNLDEFAMGSSTEHSAIQQTYNPWNLKHSPGGSSGGSAAAVAARLCPIALGSETGGSVRQPASHCGVLGLKPTYGRVSRFGLVAFGSSLDQISPFARSTRDLALTMEVLGQHCPHDSTSLPMGPDELLDKLQLADLKGKRFGVPYAFLTHLDTEARELFDRSLECLRDLGAEFVEVDLSLFEKSIAVYYILATAEASTNLARFDGIRYGQRSQNAQSLDDIYDLSRDEGFGAEVKRRILLGTFVLSAGYQDAYYKKAQKVRTLMIQQMREALKACDAIAMPVAPHPALERGAHAEPLQEYLEDLYTIAANLTGCPAISIPAGFSKQGMPVGLQLLCDQRQESLLLQLADCAERSLDCASRHPEIAK